MYNHAIIKVNFISVSALNTVYHKYFNVIISLLVDDYGAKSQILKFEGETEFFIGSRQSWADMTSSHTHSSYFFGTSVGYSAYLLGRGFDMV